MVTMNTLVNILYMVTMGAIQVWRKFMYIVAYIGFRPIKWYIRKILREVGIRFEGADKPDDIMVHDERFYHRIAYDGTLGLGETYMDGWWDCKELDVFFTKVLLLGFYKKITMPWDRLINYLQFEVFNLQTVERSWEVAEKHYDLGNELYEAMLGKSLNYTCAYWNDANNLDDAQQRKMELIGRKLKLESGMRVLDVGCGWGSLCKYLAETYNVEVVGVTVSKEGARKGQELCKGLSVDIRLQDYRDVNERFDRIVIVGMLEHVGPKNHRSLFEQLNRCLSDDGIFVLQTIGHDNDTSPSYERFVHKYIFPNGILANHKQIPANIDNLFCIEDWHNLGPHYDKTLMAWHENFVKNWDTISRLYEDPKTFYRMWTYYLLAAAGLFRSRKFQLWQIVMTKWLPGGYISVR